MRSVLRCVDHIPLVPEAALVEAPLPLADALLLWALGTAMQGEAGFATARRGLELAGGRAAWPGFHDCARMLLLTPDRPIHAVREAVALVQAGALAPATLRLREMLPATIARLIALPICRFARCYADAGLICRVRLDPAATQPRANAG